MHNRFLVSQFTSIKQDYFRVLRIIQNHKTEYVGILIETSYKIKVIHLPGSDNIPRLSNLTVDNSSFQSFCDFGGILVDVFIKYFKLNTDTFCELCIKKYEYAGERFSFISLPPIRRDV